MLRQQDRFTDMAFCTNCGTNFGPSIRFCTNCGTPQAVSAPANAPLLEYGEQARAPQQPSINFSAPVIAPTSSTNKQFILMLCIAQIASPILLVLALAINWHSFEAVREAWMPLILEGAVSVSPFVFYLVTTKYTDGLIRALMAMTSLVLGLRGLIGLMGEHELSGVSQLVLYLSQLAAITGIALGVLLIIETRISKSSLVDIADRWRAVPGFFAVLFLILENPGRVLYDSKPFLSLILFPLVVGACLLQEECRAGAAAGLGIVITSSIVGQMASKILSSYSYGSFISLPSFLALGCCLAVIAPKSIFQQKQTSVPR